jgi:hypothetical protein
MLDTFSGFPFFNLEEMHLIGHGIAHHLFDLSAVTLRGDTKHVSLYRKSEEEKDEDYGYTFDIPKQDMIRIGYLMSESRSTVPTTFNSKWENQTGGYVANRAVDWHDVIIHQFGTMIVPLYVHEATKVAVLALIRALKLSLQWRITEQDVVQIET